MIKITPDLHDELIIQRVGQGIQLAKPEIITEKTLQIETLMHMPFHMYFMDQNSTLKKFNEREALSFNLNHYRDAIGLSARDFSSRESAELSIANDRMVINKNAFLIRDESYMRLDGIDFNTLSFKFPWYDNQHKILGIFGVSFLLDAKWGVSLADSMNYIIQTGLLNARQIPALPGMQFGEIYLTKRQKEIICLMIRGKTSKETALVLGLSIRTVEHHIENIKLKTDSDSKSELIDKMIDYFVKI